MVILISVNLRIISSAQFRLGFKGPVWTTLHPPIKHTAMPVSPPFSSLEAMACMNCTPPGQLVIARKCTCPHFTLCLRGPEDAIHLMLSFNQKCNSRLWCNISLYKLAQKQLLLNLMTPTSQSSSFSPRECSHNSRAHAAPGGGDSPRGLIGLRKHFFPQLEVSLQVWMGLLRPALAKSLAEIYVDPGKEIESRKGGWIWQMPLLALSPPPS